MTGTFDIRDVLDPLHVRNGTVLISPACHDRVMPHHKAAKKSYQALFADVKKEMALPRVAKSAHDGARRPPANETAPPRSATAITPKTAVPTKGSPKPCS
jgi:hypothetical protein